MDAPRLGNSDIGENWVYSYFVHTIIGNINASWSDWTHPSETGILLTICIIIPPLPSLYWIGPESIIFWIVSVSYIINEGRYPNLSNWVKPIEAVETEIFG